MEENIKKSEIKTVQSELAVSVADGEDPEKKLDEVELIFDRNYGFSTSETKTKWKLVKRSFSQNGYKLVKKYTKRIEDELAFRFITSKKIEIVILVALGVASVLLFILESILSGVLFILALILFIYLLSCIKAKKLMQLSNRFNQIVSDLDEKYFGVKITNIFGRRKPMFYALVPFIKPDISINIKASPLVRIYPEKTRLTHFQAAKEENVQVTNLRVNSNIKDKDSVFDPQLNFSEIDFEKVSKTNQGLEDNEQSVPVVGERSQYTKTKSNKLDRNTPEDRSDRPIVSYKKVTKERHIKKTKTMKNDEKEGTSSEEANIIRSKTMDKLPLINVKGIRERHETEDMKFTNMTREQFQSNKIII